MQRLYFFDYQSTTPVDERVIEIMNENIRKFPGNPHANAHEIGWNSSIEVEESRLKIAKIINAQDEEIIFTSGATESNNLAIKGSAMFYKDKGRHIITMSIEHKCVLESCHFLSQNGFEITYLDPEPDGILDLEKLKKAIKKDTILISIMAVNNETGVIQNLEKIGQIARNNGILFHTDAAQAYGKIPIDVEKMNIDLMSISSHKIYGPKGIGALYIRKKPRVRLQPIFHGGGQERGYRSGTVPVFLVSGFAKAAELMIQDFEKDNDHISKLSKKFLDKMLQIEDCFLNGNLERKIPGCINLSILHIEGESLMMAMPEICISTGSACNSLILEPSYVISKMRNNLYYAHSAFRFGFGRQTTEEEVDYLLEKLLPAIEKMRLASPLWDMKKKGINIDEIEWKD